MPSTINGIGTMYYGKRNLQQHRAICGQCNKETVLSSYDTTLYFTVVFVPLIPLGKKHILDDCSSCRRHYSISFAKWRETLTNSLQEARDKYRQAPGDPEVAKAIVSALSANNHKDAFLDLAGDILEHHRANPEILTLVAAVCHRFDRHEDAAKLLYTALEISDDAETRLLLAEVLFSQLKPDEAAGHLQYIFDQQLADKLFHPLLLAQCYQATGQHREALEVLNNIQALNPQKSPYKALFKKLRKISQKKEFTSEPVKNQFSNPIKTKAGPEFNIGGRIAKIAGPAIVLFFLGLYLVSACMKGRSRNVCLVNGLGRPYTVRVNDQSYPLRARGNRMINISEGQIEVAVEDEQLGIDAESCLVKTPFFKRPFVNRTFIINPDKTATIYWEKIYYAEDPDNAPDGQESLHVGRLLYTFGNIDFLFQPFPAEIEISNKAVPKTRISLLTNNDVDVIQIPSILAEELGPAVAVDYLKRRIVCEPDNETYLYLLAAMTRPEQFIEIIKPGLTARPVRVQWHRMYQTMMERTRTAYDLESEYRKLLDNEPENKSLQYLLGRTIPNPAQADVYFRKSTSGDRPCPYGYNAIAYHQLSVGDCRQALDNVRAAIDLDPNNFTFTEHYYTVLQATENYAELIEHYRKARKNDPNNFSWVQEEAELLVITGRRNEAAERIKQWIAQNKDYYSVEVLDEVQQSMDILFAYLAGDLAEYSRLAQVSSDPIYRSEYCVTSGQPVEPNSIDRIKAESPYAILLLYMSRHIAGDSEAAEKHLLNAVEFIDVQGSEDKIIAKALCGPDAPDVDRICNLPMLPRAKAIALTALGLRYPDHKKRYFKLAEKLNFDRTFPHLFLKSIHENTLSKERR